MSRSSADIPGTSLKLSFNHVTGQEKYVLDISRAQLQSSVESTTQNSVASGSGSHRSLDSFRSITQYYLTTISVSTQY